MASSPSHIRHFVNYHNPDVMGCGFREAKHWRVVTHKRVRDLAGDWVWMLGRDGEDFFVYGRFRVDTDKAIAGTEAKFEVSGTNGVWFKTPARVNDLPWFSALRHKVAGTKASFVSVTDEEILDGMREIANPTAVN